MFYDPEWDGESEPGEESGTGGGGGRGGGGGTGGGGEPPTPPPNVKVEVKLSNGKKLRITEVVTRYIDADGKPLTAKEFLEKLVGFIPQLYKTEEELREQWANPDTREKLLFALEQEGFDREQLNMLREILSAKNCDIFDVLSYLSFSSEMLTRKQRVELAEGDKYFDVYTNLKAKDFLRFILQRYVQDDVDELKREKLGELIKLNNLGTPKEAANLFGGSEKLIEAFYKLQETLYKAG